MKNKFILFYSIVVSCIYLFAVTFFSYNLISEYKYGAERSKRKFDHIENTIKSNQSIKQLENAIGDLNDFAYISISSDGQNIFSYPENVDFLPEESKLIKNYSYLNTNYSVQASIYLLRPITIYNSSRISFLIIFITTALTILLIIYLNLFTSQVSNSNEMMVEELEEITEKPENLITEDDSEIISAEEKQNVIKELAETQPDESYSIDNKVEISENKSQDKLLENNNVVSDDKNIEPEKKETLPEDFSKPVEITQPIVKNEIVITSDMQNLESILEARLEKEVSRAISSEIDISLLLIRIPELDKKDSVSSSLKDLLVEEFQYADLVFDFSNDCFACIKLNTNLDDALVIADEINHKVINLLNNENKQCFIGISSRTLRMVSAKRIILEAKEALVHAQQDADSPIVAFRVDSEKYMKLMENK